MSALGGTRDGTGAPLRIYTQYRVPPDPSIERVMERELSLLVSPIGLDVAWRSLSGSSRGEVTPALVVVTFLGACNTGAWEIRNGYPRALAWTHVSDGVIIPFVDVDCDSLRNLIQGRLLRVDFRMRADLFGRAVARVIAHELYHVFAETKHHGKEGVAEPVFNATELLSEDFSFAEREFRTLRNSKLGALLRLKKPAGQPYVAEGCSACHGSSGQGTRFAPALRGSKKVLNAKALESRFDKKSEEMYRRARNLKLSWWFPSDDEIHEIVSSLSADLE